MCPGFMWVNLQPETDRKCLERLQSKADITNFKAIHSHVLEGFIGGQPRYRSQDGGSVFKIYSRDQFEALSTEQVQQDFKTRHLVVNDSGPRDGLKFDLETLGFVATDPSNEIELHGTLVALLSMISSQ